MNRRVLECLYVFAWNNRYNIDAITLTIFQSFLSSKTSKSRTRRNWKIQNWKNCFPLEKIHLLLNQVKYQHRSQYLLLNVIEQRSNGSQFKYRDDSTIISGKIAPTRKLVQHRQRIMFIGSWRKLVCKLTLEGIAPFRTVEIVGNSCLHEWPYIKFLTIGGQEFSGRDG